MDRKTGDMAIIRRTVLPDWFKKADKGRSGTSTGYAEQAAGPDCGRETKRLICGYGSGSF